MAQEISKRSFCDMFLRLVSDLNAEKRGVFYNWILQNTLEQVDIANYRNA